MIARAGRVSLVEAIWMLGAGLITAVIISVNVRASLNAFDAGISASAATFTLHGLLPYRDYWLLYGPLSGLFLALPTALLGPSIELSRALGFAVICIQASLAYRIARVWALPVPAIALAVSAVVMAPATLGLEVIAWTLAMTSALAAIYVSIGTRRSGVFIGLLVGVTFLFRLDLGVYALIGTVVVRDRRAVLIGFLAVALPFLAFALATTSADALIEQLIWYPLVGTRQYRGLPGLDALYPEPLGAILAVPLVWLPRLAIGLAVVHLVRLRIQGQGDQRILLGLLAFAASCQLQTLGRGDIQHYAQAATPALLLFAIWFQRRPAPVRFVGLVGVTSTCVALGLIGHAFHDDEARHDREIVLASAWIKGATDADERIFVGLTSHRHTVLNPLFVYYLADRAPGVRDDLFNPGVTNTDRSQRMMVDDLERNAVPYVVLDRQAPAGEQWNDSQIPGSTLLDSYLTERYETVCDLGSLVIRARVGLDRTPPPCPAVDP